MVLKIDKFAGNVHLTMKETRRILITGGSGFVGGRVQAAMNQQYDIIAPTHSELNVTCAEDVVKFAAQFKPDAVLHLAAISNTGYCEEHPDESYLANVASVENMARAAASLGAKLVWFSSDQVYNGNIESGLLPEDIAVSPENHYGRHKLLAEQRALEICPDSVALRATWMYDYLRPRMKTHGNFALNFRQAIKNGTPLRFATREFRGITWVDEVVRNLPFTFDLPGGVYNFGSENHLNTYETACRYAEFLGCDPSLVIADTERFPQHIRNISISMDKIRNASNGKIHFLTTLEGLVAFENALKREQELVEA